MQVCSQPPLCEAHENILNMLQEMRAFLMERWPDNRCAEELAEEIPVSFNNCIPTALFIEAVLAELDPAGEWTAVAGTHFCDWHAFLFSPVHRMVADLTADQFGDEAVVLRPVENQDLFEIKEPLRDCMKVVAAHEMRQFRSWHSEWTAEEHGLSTPTRSSPGPRP